MRRVKGEDRGGGTGRQARSERLVASGIPHRMFARHACPAFATFRRVFALRLVDGSMTHFMKNTTLLGMNTGL